MVDINKNISDLNKFITETYTSLLTYGNDTLTTENITIVFLIIYTSLVSMYTPRSIINLINQPVSKILILGLILYVANGNITLAIFIAIAFIVTISIDNSIEVIKVNSRPILDYDQEGFVGNEKDDELDELDEDFEDDNGKPDHNESENFDGGDHEYSQDKSDDDYEMKLSKNPKLNDTFKNLHDAIHKLESFIATKKN